LRCKYGAELETEEGDRQASFKQIEKEKKRTKMKRTSSKGAGLFVLQGHFFVYHKKTTRGLTRSSL
jgi:hypothetical protein